MNEFRRARIQCEVDALAAARERIARVRDDEDRAIRGDAKFGEGDQESTDLISEAQLVLLVAIDRLQKAKACK